MLKHNLQETGPEPFINDRLGPLGSRRVVTLHL